MQDNRRPTDEELDQLPWHYVLRVDDATIQSTIDEVQLIVDGEDLPPKRTQRAESGPEANPDEFIPFSFRRYVKEMHEVFPLDSLIMQFMEMLAVDCPERFAETVRKEAIASIDGGRLPSIRKVEPYSIRPLDFIFWLQDRYPVKNRPWVESLMIPFRKRKARGAMQETPALTDLQLRIVEELQKEPMTAPQMTEHLAAIGVERDLDTVKRAFARLKKARRVDNKRGLGYFLTSKPPSPSEDPAS